MSVERIRCPVCHDDAIVVAGGTRLRKHTRRPVDARGEILWSAPRVACEGATLDVSVLVAAEHERLCMKRLRSDVMDAERRVAQEIERRDIAVARAEQLVDDARARLAVASAVLAAAVAAEPRAPIVSPAVAARCIDDGSVPAA